ncbi:hypothetical protein [Acinetobacter sp. 10FS3-1]|uniref:hypothetical protein n=1 Tax=Acinetobacter sp. 10FS3-1 TaxID=2563897 RepID=UPI00157C2D27|nr:hypothetical protein [Acinetobacter sp. 10FS3-1]
MLKKILLVLIILAPSALYLYMVSGDDTATTQSEPTPSSTKPAEQPRYSTPDH